MVLAIMGLMASASVIGLGTLDRGGRAEAEARRLAQRLQLAADEVLVTAAPLALAWDERGYRFLGWDRAAGAWGAAAPAALGAPHVLPAALRLDAAEGETDAPLLITPDLPQPPVLLRVSGSGRDWRIAFDGFAATAAPVEP